MIRAPVRRISVVGNSGSGKSTLAARIAALLGVDHIELDALYHSPNWSPLPDHAFVAAVSERIGRDGWVVDGNYPMVRELIWSRAEAIVWLDPPRSIVMRRLLWRTLRRAVLRVELWNGNREEWRNLLSLDPEQSVIAWSWTRHGHYRETYERAQQAARVPFVRLRTDRDVEALLTELQSLRTHAMSRGRSNG